METTIINRTDAQGRTIQINIADGLTYFYTSINGAARTDGPETYYSKRYSTQVYQMAQTKVQLTKDEYDLLIAAREASRNAIQSPVAVATSHVTPAQMVATATARTNAARDILAPSVPSITPAKSRTMAARYAGTCKRSGTRYAKGAMIEETRYGWALVGTELDLGYQMDRDDSEF